MSVLPSDRLSTLHLLPPAAPGVWSCNPLHAVERVIQRGDGTRVSIDLPLFWYDPPWVNLDAEIASALAAAVAEMDVMVSALHSDVTADLGANRETPAFFKALESSPGAGVAPRYLPRMMPYRIERYGVWPEDFDQARIVDVRLSPSRDASGRYAYSPTQMKRWERPSDDAPIAGGGFVAGGTFPTDIVSLPQAQIKLNQLRRLSPTAAVFVSIGPYRLDDEIGAALVAKPDGIILRMDLPEFEGIQLAALVRRARKVLADKDHASMPLWVVPGEVSPSDVAKLIALGASAVAIDAWCNRLIGDIVEINPDPRYDRSIFHELPGMVSRHLWEDIDAVIGRVSAIVPDSDVAQRLGTYHPRWAQACGVSLLSA